MVTAEKGQNNLAFATLFQLGDPSACVDLLVKTQRAPEAALFARTYAPRFVPRHSLLFSVCRLNLHSQASKAVDAWHAELEAKKRPKIAASVAHPTNNADLFEEGWEDALALEQGQEPSSRESRFSPKPDQF
jgi:coatomer subunit beta'